MARTERQPIRLTSGEKAAWGKKAADLGVDVSELVRRAVAEYTGADRERLAELAGDLERLRELAAGQ